jgi:hypothetical protein
VPDPFSEVISVQLSEVMGILERNGAVSPLDARIHHGRTIDTAHNSL